MTNATTGTAIVVAPNNIRDIENKFDRSLGNGVLAAEYLQNLMQAVVSSGDTTIIARRLDRLSLVGKTPEETKKIQKTKGMVADPQAAQAIKLVFGQVYDGAKLTRDKETGKHSLKIKGITANADVMTRLADVVKRGLSIRHSTFRKAIKGEETNAPVEFDAAAWAARQVKAQPEKLEAMIAALQALRTPA